MSLTSIIGQPLAIELVQRWMARQSSQPLLFHGPDGVGKRTLALETAKALNCVAPEQIPCDTCLSCRKITAGNHPDVRVVDLAFQAVERQEALDKQLSLRIETALAERRRLLQTPTEGRWKVMILNDAHRLTADAANALLKILEEPPNRTALILITPDRDRLFPTIVSRCHPVRFRPLTFEEMGRCLARLRIPEESRARLIELSRGSPGGAVTLSREEQIAEASQADALWQDLTASGAGRRRILEPGFRGTRVTRADIEKKIHYFLFPAQRDLYTGQPGADVSLDLLQRAQAQLRRNVQPALVYDHLLLQLLKRRRP